MTELGADQPTIRVLHPNAGQPHFAAEIRGSGVVRLGSVELTASALTIAIAEIEPRATFPGQYHKREDGVPGLVEIAVILAGQGEIQVVGAEGSILYTCSFSPGDVVPIPSDLLYCVVNTGDEPLRACLFFTAGTTSYWSDGRKA